MASIAALSNTVYDMISKIEPIRGGVIAAALITEGYACRVRDNQPSSGRIPQFEGITIDLSKWKISLLIGACRSVHVVAFLGLTQLFKSYWISAPCALVVLVTSLPMKSSSAVLQTVLQILNVASKSLRIVAKIVNSFAVGILVQQLYAPEDLMEYEELNRAKFTGLLASLNSLFFSLYLEIDGIQKQQQQR